MRTIILVLSLFVSIQAGGVERKRAELDSLKREWEYSRRMAQTDSSYAVKAFEDSIRVQVAEEDFADEIEDSMEPNHGWVWFTACIGVTATVMSIIMIADNANSTQY